MGGLFTGPEIVSEAYNERGLAKKSKGDLEGATSDMSKAAELRQKR